MKISLMVAISKNGIIGNGPDIPWTVKGEQLLFKAMTYNQWLLVGRKTFESMGVLNNRKYAVVTRSNFISHNERVLVYPSIEKALVNLPNYTKHVIVSGGGEVYKSTIDLADTPIPVPSRLGLTNKGNSKSGESGSVTRSKFWKAGVGKSW